MAKKNSAGWIFLLLLLLAAGFFYFRGQGFESIQNIEETFDLTLSAGEVNEGIVKSNVMVTVTNSSSRRHENIRFKVKAFDRNRNLIEVRDLTFLRPLEPHGYLERLVLLPKSAKRVRCTLLGSDVVGH